MKGAVIGAGLLALTLVLSPSSEPARDGPSLVSYAQEWLRDGRTLVFSSNLHSATGDSSDTDEYTVGADGRGLTRLNRRTSEGILVPSPTGRRVALWTRPSYGLYLINPNGSARTKLADHTGGYVAWSPDGSRIAFAAGAVIHVADAASGETRRGVRGFSASWSPDGSMLAVDDGSYIYVVRADDPGTGPGIYGYGPENPLWSPDGEWIAYSDQDPSDRRWLYVMDRRAQRRRKLAYGTSPIAWSPDGRRLAYAVDYHVYVIGTDGTGRRLLNSSAHSVRFSPDWERYAFSTPSWRGFDLYVSELHGRSRVVTPSQCVVEAEPCLAGGDSRDRLRGGPKREIVLGGAGGDILLGRGGNDRLEGSLGDDFLVGNAGQDSLRGGPGSDSLVGGPAADFLLGGPGRALLRGGAGPDQIFVEDGPSRVFGGPGRDFVTSRNGARDSIACGSDRDRVFAADRFDRIAADCEIRDDRR